MISHSYLMINWEVRSSELPPFLGIAFICEVITEDIWKKQRLFLFIWFKIFLRGTCLAQSVEWLLVLAQVVVSGREIKPCSQAPCWAWNRFEILPLKQIFKKEEIRKEGRKEPRQTYILLSSRTRWHLCASRIGSHGGAEDPAGVFDLFRDPMWLTRTADWYGVWVAPCPFVDCEGRSSGVGKVCVISERQFMPEVLLVLGLLSPARVLLEMPSLLSFPVWFPIFSCLCIWPFSSVVGFRGLH